MHLSNRLLTLSAILAAGTLTAQNPMLMPEAVDAGNPVTLNLSPGIHNFGSGIEAASLGANGAILGPTLIVHQGETADWSVVNGLTESTTMHWHGMHVSPANDGGPHSIIAPGGTWNPTFEVLDEAGTYWYHPHLHMMTDMHVSKGIAGQIWVRDPQEQALALPRTYGEDEFPIVLQTKAFDAAGNIIAHSNSDTMLCVNATVDAQLEVPASVVRFHLLNGSSQRVFNFGLSDNSSFHLIATDGGLLGAPVAMNRLRLSPGERAEVLIDFTSYSGETLEFMSYASEFSNGIYGATYPGMGSGQVLNGYNPNPLNGSDFTLFTASVTAPLPANAVIEIPAELDPTNANPFDATEADITRILNMQPESMGMNALNGNFVFNGASFNMEVINYTIPLDNTEIWHISNNSPIGHPFHIHDVQFYIIERNGSAPSVDEMGRKDVVFVPAMQSVKFICKFEDFADPEIPYMYHCHMLVHEDGGMMGQFLVTDPNASVSAFAPGHLSIYPNPASDQIQLTLPPATNSVTIRDLLGRTVMDLPAASGLQSLDVSALHPGTYFGLAREFSGEVTGTFQVQVAH